MLKKLSFLIIIFLSSFTLPGLCQEENDLIPQQTAIPAIKSTYNPIAEIKKLGYEEFTAEALMDERVIKIFQRMFQESPFKTISQEDVRKIILAHAHKSGMDKALSRSPRVLETMVDILRDDKAMPGLIGIFLRREDLKIYGIIWISIFVLGYLIKRHVYRKMWKESFLKRCLLSLVLTTASLTIFYQMFHEELNPTVEIICHHWRRRNIEI